MAVTAKENGGGDFAPPPTGLHPALCIDVVDLGEVETPFKHDKGPLAGQPKWAHQILIVWQLHNEDEDGEPMVRNDGKPFRILRYYTLSLNEKANLRKDLDSWRGKPFTEEELVEGFDVEKLLNVQCKLNLIGKRNAKGETKTVVSAVLPPSKRDPKIEADPEYVREKDRPGGRDVRSPKAEAEEEKPAGGSGSDPFDDDDQDDLPF